MPVRTLCVLWALFAGCTALAIAALHAQQWGIALFAAVTGATALWASGGTDGGFSRRAARDARRQARITATWH